MNVEKYLVLNKYLLSLFGVSSFRELQEKLRDIETGVDSDGKSYFVRFLCSLENLRRDKISEDDILRYDSNIQSYLNKINSKREPITLKYFQYLAVLFTEIVLDNLKNRKHEFLHDLNEFLEKYKKEHDIEIIDKFTERDLKKLAFWMATGSGKTLIAHINYYQFLHYNLFNPDNIIFITPNEGLSKQHFEELQKSGIPCKLYSGNLSISRKDKEVLVIEITKFVEEKKGGGVTLSVDTFEGRNLVFVDEGHKGKKSEERKWAKLIKKLSEDGFVFEYSATFGQILSEKNEEILVEYAKSIIFDYSYKYFYLDGYGKDFSIFNIKEVKIGAQAFKEIMFVANLLSFYEQLLAYEENKHLAKEYNIEKPLWIFVGTTVTGKGEESDVIQIVELINKVLKDEEWFKKSARDILEGKTQLKDEEGKDVFRSKFKYLREIVIHLDDLYRRVFGGKGNLRIYELKNAEGEFGLKVAENEYFGVINIGDVSSFKKQLEKIGISVEQDVISASLFDSIKREDSKINILIGSKKFIEGWDTWRVSSMGLINIGKEQGPQIIQLFGRGVRLKGKGMSLKRSKEYLSINEKIDNKKKLVLEVLETLNIYSIKADYLNKFLEAIKKEEVEFETIEIPVEPRHKDKWESLYILSEKERGKKFEEEKILRLKLEERFPVTLDLIPKMSRYLAEEKREEGIKMDQISVKIDAFGKDDFKNVIDLLDWDRIYLEICRFKIEKGYWNLIFDMNMLKNLLLSDRYRVKAFPDLLNIKSEEDLRRVEEIAILIIKKYLDLFYRIHIKEFETENLRYEKLGEQVVFSAFKKTNERYNYVLQINKKEKDLIDKIRNLVKNLKRLQEDDEETLPRIYFDNHLYVPILLYDKKIEKISPPGLVESEHKFVKELKNYLEKNKGKFAGCEIYLLRNYPFSGIGFQLYWSKFYPDFIMWIKNGNEQIIVFIDPKGLEHTKNLDDEKIKFTKGIKKIEQKLGRKDIRLTAFILSITPYNNLTRGLVHHIPSKEEYIKNHVLFLDDTDWPENLFSMLNLINDS